MCRGLFSVVFLAGALGFCVAASAKEPFTFNAMMKLGRIGDPQLSPDGRTVAFTIQTVDMTANTTPVQIYTVPLAGGEPRRLTHEGSQNTRPRWTPDSKRIVFTSNWRNGTQIWSMNADGSEPVELTDVPTEAAGELVSPDGKLLLFSSAVYPVCSADDAKPDVAYDAACNKAKRDEEAASKMHARLYTHLLYRHWTEYQDARRKHLLIQPLAGGPAKDLTPGTRDVPPFSLGGPEGYAFSPESSEVMYTSNVSPDLATSTNSDLFVIGVNGGVTQKITDNPAADEGPLYSPDGKYVAYRMQIRAGYESDRWRLAVWERATGKLTVLTPNLDLWVDSYVWSPDSASLFFTVEDHGRQPLMMVPADGSGGIRTV